MKIEQIYTGCLAQGAYYIESEGEVAIIDPLREVKPYLERAKNDGAKIKYILETHFHADFVSGHVTLAKETGATIVFGPNANPSFDVKIAEDAEILELGNIKIKVLHTPGHTMESTCYLLIDEKGKEHSLFSGDTLFLGDVGRPDLAQKAAHMTQEDLAGILFDSLRTKVMTLADDVTVYPAHGAGSACGKNMMKETVDSLGNQKQMNYALRADMTREEFVKEVTDGLLPPPMYFPMNVKMNKEGYDDIDVVLERGTKAYSPDVFQAVANETNAVILDVRAVSEFVEGFIPKSISIGIDGQFAPWVGALIADVKQAILLVLPEGREEEVVTRLSRVGFDNTLGYLKGGFNAWRNTGKEIDTIKSISAEVFKSEKETCPLPIFDVRKPGEYAGEHLEEAYNTPLDFINEHFSDFPRDQDFYIHCAGGYRSVIAASILKSRGIHNLIDISSGFAGIKETGIPTTDFVCPSKAL
ncbi:MAG: MBL fold metallo-hydrolase [Bacteroidetes bacterium]|nr:MAG: MBL fold metallo-hydrolase [Bacteroidota bacterium]MBL1144710.1 MBL fold metallo-hydrolase [Bacteroidota bacterium]NOG57504.1 MBL fold metallo-hydrolase [Bacteroidota bacterium]